MIIIGLISMCICIFVAQIIEMIKYTTFPEKQSMTTTSSLTQMEN